MNDLMRLIEATDRAEQLAKLALYCMGPAGTKDPLTIPIVRGYLEQIVREMHDKNIDARLEMMRFEEQPIDESEPSGIELEGSWWNRKVA